ncbi:MAG TPA: alpha/beta fold hydrolase, partial [Polyangiaceae bacterium]|nr:alpha/beta fold hydrolase [Polyangiaceae bacterium]
MSFASTRTPGSIENGGRHETPVTTAATSAEPVVAEPIRLETADGHELAGTLYASQAVSPLGTVIINSATAAPQVFYRRYAQYLARSGARVLTYDYRGIGQSRPESLRGFAATLSDWAEYDARAAFQFVSAEFPNSPLAFVGHSFGGQLIGLVDEVRSAKAAVLV